MNDTLTLRLLYTVNKVVDMTTANAVWPRDGKAYSHFVEAGSFSGPPSRGLPFSMGSIWSHSVARGSDTDAREGARSCTESQRRASCVRRVRGEAMGNVETGGTLTVETVSEEMRSFSVGDFAIVPVGVRQVHASGTTASGIHAFKV